MDYINLNGQLTARDQTFVSTGNQAFRNGQGLLETMLVRDGEILLEEYHWSRLFSGMEKLGIKPAGLFDADRFTAEALKREVMTCVRKNGMERLCRVRLQVCEGGPGLTGSRGLTGFSGSVGLTESPELAGLKEDAGSTGLTGSPELTGLTGPAGHRSARPEFLIECLPVDVALTALNKQGVVVGIAEGLFKGHDALANLKTTGRLMYLAAERQALRQGWDEALILNAEGNVLESTIANIFWFREGQWCTPPLEDGCVAGVMRRFVMERMDDQGIPVAERSLAPAELDRAEEIFLTNAIRRIRWVGATGLRKLRCNRTKEIYHSLFGSGG